MIHWKSLSVGAVLAFAAICENVYPQSADSDEAKIKAAMANLPKLRAESIALLNDSRKNNPEHFKILMGMTDDRVGNFLKADIRPIDLSTVVGAKYSEYNKDIWRIVGVAHDLLSLAQAYSSPDSRHYNKQELPKKAAQGFEFILSLMRPEGGTCGAPDANIDRFTYGASWDAFVLIGEALPEGIRTKFAKHLLKAAQFQLSTYGNPKWEKYGFSGKYPNMDAAYVLVLVQANQLFENGDRKGEFGKEIDPRVDLLEKCLVGSAWMYILDWNPAPQYTRVTLDWFGRAYQIAKDPKMLKQIQAHADHYKYFLEPNGLMDNGMSPFIKHDWNMGTFGYAMDSLEFVHRYAPTPVLQHLVDEMYKRIALQWAWHLFWVSPDLGKREDIPRNFIRECPENGGFQARHTDSIGTITAYTSDRSIAMDTRVSAMVSSAKSTSNDCILAGVFIEVFQNEASYFIGDMKPRVKSEISKNSATLTAVQGRHMMGPKAIPMLFGNHLVEVRNWKFDCWKGGSPTGPPVETSEKWVWSGGRLNGEIVVTALEDVKLDGVRIMLPTRGADLSEKMEIPSGEAQRYGNLCLSLQRSGASTATEVIKKFDFRADVPTGEYIVTVVTGDPASDTPPFNVIANDETVLENVAAAKGTLTERSFSIKVKKDEGLDLQFFTRSTGSQWKIASIEITAKDGKGYSKKFDVGTSKFAPIKGYEKLTGKDLYSKEKGYGWARDLSSYERSVGDTPVNLSSDYIAAVATSQYFGYMDGAKEWKKGQALTFQVTVGLGETLASWLPKK